MAAAPAANWRSWPGCVRAGASSRRTCRPTCSPWPASAAPGSGLLERIELHCGDVAGLPPAPPCDAALVLLVLHFLRGDQAKRRFLEAVAERLAPAAPLLLANLMEARDAFERPVQAEACRLAGLSPEDSDGMLQRLREDFDPLSEQRLGELLEDTGFVLPSRYFQAVGYQAWIAFRAG
ncbi:hypothetical protein AAHB60_15430 [Pseudomonas aeruginosa]